MKKIVILLFVFIAGFLTQDFFQQKQKRHSEEGFRKFNSVFRIRKDERYFTRHMSNVKNPRFNTNEEGFRDTESFEKKISLNCETPVIVLLGGSGIFGTKLTFPETLGSVLQTEMKVAGMPARVFNLGQLGFTVIQGKRLAEDWFSVLQPDLLILNYGHYEMMPAAGGETMREILEGAPPSVLSSLWRKSQLFFLDLFSIRGHHPPNLTMDDFTASLKVIMDTGKLYGAESFVLPVGTSVKYSNDVFNFNQRMQNEMKEVSHHTSLSDFSREDYFAEDGAHYSALGVKELVKRLVPDILQTLKKKTLNKSCGQKRG